MKMHRLRSTTTVTSAPKIRFEIECGERRVIEAPTPQRAWAIFVNGKPEDALAPMARFREIPWNSVFSWDKAVGRKQKGKWHFVEPAWFARAENAS